jgi:hypothetical protein
VKLYTVKLNAAAGCDAFNKKAGPRWMPIMLLTIMFFVANPSFAAIYYLTFLGSGSAQIPASWNSNPAGGGKSPANFSTSGDKFIIPLGINGIVNGNWMLENSSKASEITLIIEGALTINQGYSIVLSHNNEGSSKIILNGTINFMDRSHSQLLGIGDADKNPVEINAGATVNSMNSMGLISGNAGSINPGNLAVSISPAANFEFSDGSQILSGLPGAVNNLKISGAENSVKTLRHSVTVNGILTIDPSITLSYGKEEALTINLTGTENNTLVNKGKIDMSAGNHAHILKIAAPLTAFFGTLIPGLGTVEYNAQSSQMINSANYYGLTLSESGAKMISVGTIVNGTLSLKGSAKASSFPVEYGRAGILEYRGSTAQVMSGIEFPVNNGPASLTINNPYGVRLTGSRTITGTLSLVSGVLTLGTHDLVLEENAAITGGSSLSFVYTNASGTLKWKNLKAMSKRFFPVGYSNNTTGYVPVTLTLNPGSASSDYSILAFNEALAYGGRTCAASGINDHMACVWDISRSDNGYADLNIQLQWDKQNEAAEFSYNDCTLSRFANGSWSNVNGSKIINNGNPNIALVEHYTGDLAPFAIGNESSPLPVKLIYLSTMKDNDAAVIDWATVSEQNTGYFFVEKSKDGENFQVIGTVKGAGKSTSITPYQFVDQNLEAGVSYYRLKQTDNSGEIIYTKIVTLDNRTARMPCVVYMQPVSSSVTIANEDNASATIQLLDMAGKLVYTGSIGAHQNQELTTADLPLGVYSVSWINSDTVINQRIIIR